MQRQLRLDSCRALAALAVAISHIAAIQFTPFLDTDETSRSELLRFVFSLGAPAVDFFFVLSGYVLALSVKRHQERGGVLFRFVLARWGRLLPMAWCGVALGILIRQLDLEFPAGTGELVRHLSAPVDFTSQAPWSFSWPIPDTSRYNAPLWTLYPEMHAALFIPPAVVIAGLYPRSFFPASVALALVFALAANNTYPLLFPAFGLGVLFAKVEGKFRTADIATGLTLGFIILLCRSWMFTETAYLHLFAPIGAVMLIKVAKDAGRAPWLDHPVMIGFGRASFGFYIVHYPIMVLTVSVAGNDMPPWAAAALSLPLSMVAGVVLTETVDVWSVKLSRLMLGRPNSSKMA